MSKEKINLGKKGEELVATYLENLGFVVLHKNYTSKLGEIDLIAQKGEVLAFVEVKLRNNAKFDLSELIVRSKQNKIIKTALRYISLNQFYDMVFRFDVALINAVNDNFEIKYIPNAFTKLED